MCVCGIELVELNTFAILGPGVGENGKQIEILPRIEKHLARISENTFLMGTREREKKAKAKEIV